ASNFVRTSSRWSSELPGWYSMRIRYRLLPVVELKELGRCCDGTCRAESPRERRHLRRHEASLCQKLFRAEKFVRIGVGDEAAAGKKQDSASILRNQRHVMGDHDDRVSAR